MDYLQNDLWNVKTLLEFNQLNFDLLLNSSNLIGSEQYIKLSDAKDDVIDGFEATKQHKSSSVKTTYFIKTKYATQLPIMIKPDSLRKIRYKQKVYFLLCDATPVKINPEHIFNLRQLVDNSGLTTHTHPNHYTIYKILVLAHRLGKMCSRVVTESAFGKDKYIEMVRLLLNETTVLTDPTIAKLNNRIQHDKYLAVSEMPGITSGDLFGQLCNALVAIGDDRQVLDNRARATHGTSESAIIGNKSVMFIHNPMEYYHNLAKARLGFEEIYPYNVLNRYIPFRFEGFTIGEFTDNLNHEQYAKEHSQVLKDWIKSALWYQEHWNELSNAYGVDSQKYSFKKKEERYQCNFSRFALAVSQYAKNQDEYDNLLNIAYDAYLRQKNEIANDKYKEGKLS